MPNMTHIREVLADLVFPEGKERRDKAIRDANTDPLTGLPNRRALDLALPTAEADRDTWVVVFDLNGFKRLNDMAGHPTGDKALRDFARCLKFSCYGRGGRPFRMGGDEFVVLCPGEQAVVISSMVVAKWRYRTLGLEVTAMAAFRKTLAEADSVLMRRKAERGGPR